MRPAALIGRDRIEAIRMLTAGHSARAVARRFDISPTTAAKMAKALRSRPVAPPPRSSPARVTPQTSTRCRPLPGAAIGNSEVLAADLPMRLELRDGLAADFRGAVEPRERALVAAALTSTLDAIRRVLSVADVDPEDDDESDLFDQYMLRIFGRARVVVGAVVGTADPAVPTQKEARS